MSHIISPAAKVAQRTPACSQITACQFEALEPRRLLSIPNLVHTTASLPNTSPVYSATAIGHKALFFASGSIDDGIDVYDAASNTWAATQSPTPAYQFVGVGGSKAVFLG